jgi:hypothetical protein
MRWLGSGHLAAAAMALLADFMDVGFFLRLHRKTELLAAIHSYLRKLRAQLLVSTTTRRTNFTSHSLIPPSSTHLALRC